MNTGDLILQLMLVIFLLGILAVVFFISRSIISKSKNKTDHIEEKLDKVLELLEKNHK